MRDTFSGTIEEQQGKHKLALVAPLYWQHALNKLPVGKKVWIKIDTREPKRSEQQNKFYWLYLDMIAESTGHRPEELHELFKGKFLTLGIKEIYGEKTRVKRSTTTLSKSEFCEYILSIHALTGIPPPDTRNYDIAPLLKE